MSPEFGSGQGRIITWRKMTHRVSSCCWGKKKPVCSVNGNDCFRALMDCSYLVIFFQASDAVYNIILMACERFSAHCNPSHETAQTVLLHFPHQLKDLCKVAKLSMHYIYWEIIRWDVILLTGRTGSKHMTLRLICSWPQRDHLVSRSLYIPVLNIFNNAITLSKENIFGIAKSLSINFK